MRSADNYLKERLLRFSKNLILKMSVGVRKCVKTTLKDSSKIQTKGDSRETKN